MHWVAGAYKGFRTREWLDFDCTTLGMNYSLLLEQFTHSHGKYKQRYFYAC